MRRAPSDRAVRLSVAVVEVVAGVTVGERVEAYVAQMALYFPLPVPLLIRLSPLLPSHLLELAFVAALPPVAGHWAVVLRKPAIQSQTATAIARSTDVGRNIQ